MELPAHRSERRILPKPDRTISFLLLQPPSNSSAGAPRSASRTFQTRIYPPNLPLSFRRLIARESRNLWGMIASCERFHDAG
jgi:hypothetical protein